MPFFSRVFKHRDGPRASSKLDKHANGNDSAVALPKPRWEDAWSRKEVAPEEIQELIHVCTQEMKSRALDMPFLLLPFRLHSDPSAARSFIRNFFKSSYERSALCTGASLQHELRLTEPMVLCSIMKWCWSRMPQGVVTWDAYEMFKMGEQDSNMARHAFNAFIPISVDSDARKEIIFDFFDLLAAVAARGKTNGLGGRKLSRMAGWWAFEHSDGGKGFDGGYRSWASAADATSHLFFAYLRSLSPDSVTGVSGISTLPRSLQALLSQTEYPPETPMLMQTSTTKVVMIVDQVSPTPFALLRRAKNFEYRDDDQVLQQFSAYDDPIRALSDECRRVLNCISNTNQSASVSNGAGADAGVPDASWSRFEDMGFSGVDDMSSLGSNGSGFGSKQNGMQGLRSTPGSRPTELGRPTTPSWADFLSSGFVEENGKSSPPPLLLPPDKVLPPLSVSRVQSSQSVLSSVTQDSNLEPGELASITQFELDETFWWVWMTSLANEESTERKAVFGRCALIETRIGGGKWLVMEEQVKGASPGPEEGAYIAEKKGRFSFTKRGRLGRRKSTGKKPVPKVEEPYNRTNASTPMSKTSIGPDQHARIQAAAAELARKQREQTAGADAQRRGRTDDESYNKTASVMTLQPLLNDEAGLAMKWAREFDRGVIREKYLGDINLGAGPSREDVYAGGSTTTLPKANGILSPGLPKEISNRDLPSLPAETEMRTPDPELPSPPPAPLPVVPHSYDVQALKPEAATAAKVPIPLVTPVADEKATSIVPSPETSPIMEQHPAFRQNAPERRPVESPRASTTDEPIKRAWESKSSSPEAAINKEPPPPKKLAKTQGAVGFKKMFGKPRGDGMDRPQAQQLTAIQSGLQPPTTNLGRRMSALRKRPPPSKNAVQPPVEVVAAQEPASPVAAEPIPSEIAEPSPPPAYTHTHDYGYPAVTVPAAPVPATHERHEPEKPTTQFNQGPLEDMPAYVPDAIPEKEARPPSPPIQFRTRAAAALYQNAHPSQSDLVSKQPEVVVQDDASETSVDLTRSISPAQDRWAQIRKNAAERAARMEEQSKRNNSQINLANGTTEDGETSGEETIESRVARIKARVAELTGNPEGQSPVAAPVRRY
ncbi:hypothetical protein H2199_002664 [Coniosporium tulheliwenetii]|uniref:Uncharacterized protein n=1 Tax=Coniosporium tulheliwenetii TaxID=3383036 RepID=A0ACC2ZFN4_9PEZI|nr:hypothetical protein H2199_002664 [Cladosporium sp. JES 115]